MPFYRVKKYNVVAYILIVITVYIVFLKGWIIHDPDFDVYKGMYELTSLGKMDSLERNDFGFTYLMIFFASAEMPFELFLWCICLTSVFIKALSVARLSQAYLIPFCIFYLFSFFLIHEMIQIRIALAVSIFYLSLIFIREKAFWYFFFTAALALFASLFHFSILLLFVASIVFSRFVVSWVNVVFFLFLFFVFSEISVSLISLFLEFSENKLVSAYLFQLSEGFNFSHKALFHPQTFLSLVSLFFFIFLNRLLIDYKSKLSVEDMILNLNVCLFILSIFVFLLTLSVSEVIAYRLSELFRVLSPLSSAIYFIKLRKVGYGSFYRLLIICLIIPNSYSFIKVYF